MGNYFNGITNWGNNASKTNGMTIKKEEKHDSIPWSPERYRKVGDNVYEDSKTGKRYRGDGESID